MLDFGEWGRSADLVELRPTIKAIVFDLDGTLYVSRELGREIFACATRYLAGLRGLPAEETGELIRTTRRRLTEEGGWEASLSAALMELGGELTELHRRFVAELEPERFLVPDERVVGLITALATSYDLSLYTNNNRILADRILAATGLTGLFHREFTIEETWRPKPDRVTLERVLAAVGHPPERVLFVGDREDIDLRLPASLGCPIYRTRTIEVFLNLARLIDEENAHE